MKRKLAFAAAGVLLVSSFVLYPRVQSYLEREQIDRANEATIRAVKQQGQMTIHSKDSIVSIPNKAYLDIPWFCQAPHENPDSWKIHKESCEEAALLMVLYHLTGRKKTDKDKIHAQLVDMIDWQMQTWGIHKDLHADSVKLLAMEYFGLADTDVEIIRKATPDTLRSLLSRGFPVIVPTAGRMLGNPYFTPPGPLYHMVVVTGYTSDRVITNDIGTKRGRDFSYPWDVFMKSMNHEGGDVIILKVHDPKFPERPAYRP
jgi:hypothetical protein